ncbi:MAG: hypothetical protein GX893_06860 [Firmicutes bacterium]|nr:hypothetical protein [Bacillota bacterium]NLZ92527.1 hypothetical protein [Bacillota bacterium]
MKRKIFTVSLILALVFAFIKAPIASMANISYGNSHKDNVRVFVGGSRSPLLSLKYKAERHGLLQELSKDSLNAKKKFTATIAFKDFQSIDAVQTLLEKYDVSAVGACYWPEGFQGRAVATFDETVKLKETLTTETQKAYAGFETDKLTEDEIIENYGTDFPIVWNKLTSGDFKLFAVDIYASPDILVEITKETFVDLIDVHYHTAAEETAAKEKRSINYIVLVNKPDGTL